jgi:hypothetical protein
MACVTQTRATLRPGGPDWPHAFHGCVEKLLVNQRDLKPLPALSALSSVRTIVCGPWSPVAARPWDLSLSLGGGTGTKRRFLSRSVLCRVPACCVLFRATSFRPSLFKPAPQHALHSLRAVRAKQPWLDTSLSPALFARARAFAVPLSHFHSRWDGQELQQQQAKFQEGVRGGRAPANKAHSYTPTTTLCANPALSMADNDPHVLRLPHTSPLLVYICCLDF